MVQVKFLGHACFQFDDGQYKVLVDPFLMGNPSAAVSFRVITTVSPCLLMRFSNILRKKE